MENKGCSISADILTSFVYFKNCDGAHVDTPKRV